MLATNDETVSLARNLGAQRVELGLPEGLRPGQLRPSTPPFPEVPQIVWIGRFLPLEAAGLALAAFRRVSHRGTPCAAHLGWGRSDPRRHRGVSCRSCRLRRSPLHWAPALGRGAGTAREARVHLFTSVRDSSSAQTLEAAALGVPTVALDAYGSKSFLHRPGFSLVEPLPGDGLDARFAAALCTCWGSLGPGGSRESDGARAFAAEHPVPRTSRDSPWRVPRRPPGDADH